MSRTNQGNKAPLFCKLDQGHVHVCCSAACALPSHAQHPLACSSHRVHKVYQCAAQQAHSACTPYGHPLGMDEYGQRSASSHGSASAQLHAMGRGVGKLERGPRLFVHACMHARLHAAGSTGPCLASHDFWGVLSGWLETAGPVQDSDLPRLGELGARRRCGAAVPTTAALSCFCSSPSWPCWCLVWLAEPCCRLTLASFLLGLTGHPTPVVK